MGKGETEPWDEPWWSRENLIRYAAKSFWPAMIGKATEYKKLCKDLGLLGYDSRSTSAEQVVESWAKAGWVRFSEGHRELSLTDAGINQLKRWNAGSNMNISNKVFIVHGQDEAMKQAVARTLENLGLEPIILHEQPDKGLTIIEKFVNYSDVGYAVVLLSPDDMGYPKTSTPVKARPRARQNVVLELGFFLGKLGRSHVLALHRSAPNFEMPSDYVGVIYKPFDEAGAWRYELGRELKAAGYEIDLNKVSA